MYNTDTKAPDTSRSSSLRFWAQALIHRGNHVWTPDDLSHVRQLCPSLPEALDDPESKSSKISVDTALRYLQMAHHFAVKAALFHACTDLMELQLPAYKSRGDYKQLATTHEMLREIYEAIRDQVRRGFSACRLQKGHISVIKCFGVPFYMG